MGVCGAFVYSPSVKILAQMSGHNRMGEAIGTMEASAASGMFLSLTALPVLAAKMSLAVKFPIYWHIENQCLILVRPLLAGTSSV